MSTTVHGDRRSLPHHIIKKARVTEKTTHAAQRYNCYVIEVSVSSTKTEIKSAVESAWSVRVIGLRTQMRVGKPRRRRSIVSAPSAKKFAYVTLHSDDRLNFI